MAAKLIRMPSGRTIQSSCIGAGLALASAPKDNVALSDVNLAGLVEDSAVPHSELAIHVSAAGREIIKASCDRQLRYCHIVYEKPTGECGYTHGLAGEVLSDDWRKQFRDLLGLKEG